jgi:hypothetical protein
MGNEWHLPDLIGYFYPDMPSTWGTDEIVTRGDVNYYRTAYSFLRQLPDTCEAYDIDDDELAQILYSSLMGRALHWWSNLPSLSKDALASNKDRWYDALWSAFKLSPDETFTAFDNVRYTISDALDHKHPIVYIKLLKLAAEQCGIPENELTIWAWQHLEYPIRRLIPRPRKGITMNGFRDVLCWNLDREYWNKPLSHSKAFPRKPVEKSFKSQPIPFAQQPPSHSLPLEKLQEDNTQCHSGSLPESSTSLPIQKPIPSAQQPPSHSLPLEKLQEENTQCHSVSLPESSTSLPIKKPIPNRSVPRKPKAIRAKPPITKVTHPDTESPSTRVNLYSKRGMTISPSSMARIPIRNHLSDNKDSNPLFTPTVLFSTRCRFTLDADFLKVFNYSSKPFTINRRDCLGSIHRQPP